LSRVRSNKKRFSVGIHQASSNQFHSTTSTIQHSLEIPEAVILSGIVRVPHLWSKPPTLPKSYGRSSICHYLPAKARFGVLRYAPTMPTPLNLPCGFPEGSGESLVAADTLFVVLVESGCPPLRKSWVYKSRALRQVNS